MWFVLKFKYTIIKYINTIVKEIEGELIAL